MSSGFRDGRGFPAQRTPLLPHPQGPQAEEVPQGKGNSSAAGEDKSRKRKVRAVCDAEIDLAAVYAESCKTKDQFKLQYMEAKDEWKAAYLADRHETRLEAASRQREVLRIHQLKMAKE